MMARVFHTNDRTFANFQEGELRKLCGVSPGEWPLYVVKELVDNAVAFGEETGRPVMITVTIDPDFVEIKDNGSGISDRVLDKVLDFSQFGGSNRHHKLPTRGAQGNALMTIVGIVAIWGTAVEFGRTTEPSTRLTVSIDTVRERVDVVRESISDGPEGSFVRVEWPKLPTKRGGTDYSAILDVLKRFVRVNPHVTFVIKPFFSKMLMVPAITRGGALPSTVVSGAALWFTSEEIADRLAADIRAMPNLGLEDWMKAFMGYSSSSPVGPAISTIVGDDKNELRTLASRLRAKLVAGGSSVSDPKFNPVGADSLSRMLFDDGADTNAVVQYSSESGSFMRGNAKIPFLVEVCLVQMPVGSHNAPPVALCMNRTVLYGSPNIDTIKYREKVRGEWHNTSGSVQTYASVYQFEHGQTPAACVVHVTCPSPGYKSYGKHQFDTEWLGEPLSNCMEQVTLQIRRQRAGEARRHTSGPKIEHKTIKDTLFQVLPGVHDDYTEGGRLPILIRNLYYGVRGVWERHHEDELQYATFCTYVDLYEQSIGHPICLKDPRGTLLEPHSGRTLRLGTDEVSKYKPHKWEGHTIIFIEKENFAHILRDYGIMKRWDAIVIGSKGFAVEACREVLQKYKRLLGGLVKIVALHDADPAGYMIGHDLATNLPRFGENIEIQVIDAGLTMRDATSMNLMTEPFELKQANWKMVYNMRRVLRKNPNGSRTPMLEQEAWDAFMPAMYRGTEYPSWATNPRGRRVELNAMKPRAFITWLENLLESNGCRKVRPPDDIIDEKLRDSRESKVRGDVGKVLMELLGENLVHEIIGEIGVATVDLDRVLAGRPEQHWTTICENAAQRGIDIGPIIREKLSRRLG